MSTQDCSSERLKVELASEDSPVADGVADMSRNMSGVDLRSCMFERASRVRDCIMQVVLPSLPSSLLIPSSLSSSPMVIEEGKAWDFDCLPTL